MFSTINVTLWEFVTAKIESDYQLQSDSELTLANHCNHRLLMLKVDCFNVLSTSTRNVLNTSSHTGLSLVTVFNACFKHLRVVA